MGNSLYHGNLEELYEDEDTSVQSFSISLMKYQVRKLRAYSKKNLIVSMSSFIRQAIDFYMLYKEKIIVPRPELTVEDWLEENGKHIIKRLD